MPKRIATVSTVVIRDGKRVAVGPGSKHTKAFDFTDGEIESILRVSPGALRKPVNESADADEGRKPDDSKAGKKASSSSAPEGSKKATAGKGRKSTAKADSDERSKTGGKANASAETGADEEADEDADDVNDDADADADADDAGNDDESGEDDDI